MRKQGKNVNGKVCLGPGEDEAGPEAAASVNKRSPQDVSIKLMGLAS